MDFRPLLTHSSAAMVALILLGCASPKPQPMNAKNPNADFAADKWDCQKQVAAMARPAAAAPAPTERVTRCATAGPEEVECRSSDRSRGGSAVDGVLSGMAARQAQDETAGAMPNCMTAKGWR